MQVMILGKSSQALFIFKGIGRIHPADPYGMEGGYAQGDKNGDQGRYGKQVPVGTDVPAEIIQPAVNAEPGQGPANQVGYHDQQKEFPGE